MEERIVCAANRNPDTGLVVLGLRHFDAMMQSYGVNLRQYTEQGFITNIRRFVDRKEAWTIAENNGQILRRVGGDGKELYSENLY